MGITKKVVPGAKKLTRSKVNPKAANKHAKKPTENAVQVWFNKLLFTTTEQQALLEDLATLVEDGVPANKAIEVIAAIEKGSKKFVVDAMIDTISQGRPIADGMMGWFSQATIELVRAGEQGGTLANNIRVAAEALGTKSETLSSLASSLTYPLIVIIAGCGVLIYMKSSVFAQFATIKPVSQWPEQGQQLMALASFLENWWWLVVVVILAVIVGLAYILHNAVGETRKVIDSFPGFKLYRQIAAARFMETLGLLISNGVVFKQSLKILQHKASPYLGWHLLNMEFRLGRGRSNIADVLDTGLVSYDDVLRLRAIADSKGFEHALIRLGKFAGDSAAKKVRKLGKLLGGVFLAIAAMFAGMMVTGIYSVGQSLS